MTENRPPYFSGIVVPLRFRWDPNIDRVSPPGLPGKPIVSLSLLFSVSAATEGLSFFAESMGIHGSDVGDVWMDPGWILAVPSGKLT